MFPFEPSFEQSLQFRYEIESFWWNFLFYSAPAKVNKLLQNIIINFMKNKPALARGELDENESRLEWAPLLVTLQAAEPSLQLDFWMNVIRIYF